MPASPQPVGSSTPSRSAISRSAYAATRGSCVTSTHGRLLLARQPDELASTCSPASVSSAPVGSSANSTRGSVTSARASARALLLAAGHLAGPRVGQLGDAEPLQPRQRRRARLAPPRAGEQQRQRDVLGRGQLRRRAGRTGTARRTRSAAAASAPPPIALVEPFAAVAHLARVRAQDPGQAVQQRRLAAAARAGDGDDLARLDRQRDAAQRRGVLPYGPTTRGLRCADGFASVLASIERSQTSDAVRRRGPGWSAASAGPRRDGRWRSRRRSRRRATRPGRS